MPDCLAIGSIPQSPWMCTDVLGRMQNASFEPMLRNGTPGPTVVLFSGDSVPILTMLFKHQFTHPIAVADRFFPNTLARVSHLLSHLSH